MLSLPLKSSWKVHQEGITRKLLDMIFDLYGQVESLVKDGDVDVSQKRCIVKKLKRLVIYESWLEEQLKEVEAADQGKDQQLKSIIDIIDQIETMSTLSMELSLPKELTNGRTGC